MCVHFISYSQYNVRGVDEELSFDVFGYCRWTRNRKDSDVLLQDLGKCTKDIKVDVAFISTSEFP